LFKGYWLSGRGLPQYVEGSGFYSQNNQTKEKEKQALKANKYIRIYAKGN
jgi:hypothetical protein